MNDKSLEDYLRSSRPVMKDDQTFILRTLRNMEQVEGIKEEVDRQRRHGRTAVLAALFIGMLAGLFIAAAMTLFPEASAALKQTMTDILFAIPYSWLLFITTFAILAVTLCLVIPPRHRV